MKYRYTTSYTGNFIRTARVYSDDDHSLSDTLICQEALRVIQRLIACGYEAYIVGGSIRDLLLGIRPKDFDVVTNAPPRKIRSLFRNAFVIGRRFLLVHVLFGDMRVEVATFRSLGSREKEQQWGTIDEDVRRRDFTVNALYYSPAENIILDFVEAMDDVENRILRPVIALDTIFVEDPVRLIRAVRYSKNLDLKYTRKLQKKMLQSPHLLSKVTETRLTEEFLKILASSAFARIFEELATSKMLSYILPNIAKYLERNSFFYTRWIDDLLDCESKLNQSAAANGDGQNSSKQTLKIRNGQITFALCRQILLESSFSSVSKKDRRAVLQSRIKTVLEPLMPPNQFVGSAAQEFIRQEL